MRLLRNILLVLALPAGALGYALGGWVLAALPVPGLSQGLVGLFVPLLVGGLFMLPCVIPFFDNKARQDLAAHRQTREAGPDRRADGPGQKR